VTAGRLFANVIGGALISGFLGALAALFVVPIPETNRDLVTYMLGQLSGFAGGIIAYYYASKAGDTRAQDLDAERTANTGKALDMAREAIAATPPGPVKAEIVNDERNRVPVDPQP
jgi:hypothetical protein